MVKESIADILDKAADLIEPPGRWIKGSSARTAAGEVIMPQAGTAVCWCASGAIRRVSDNHTEQRDAHRFMRRMLRQDLWTWNDQLRRTQTEVVAKLREAAAKAREQER